MKFQEFIEDFYNNNYDKYKSELNSRLEANNYKLYRYVPVHNIIKSMNEIEINLLHKEQFGIDSLLNKYIYHNKPSFFNDPYDCVFGISTNAFFRELLGYFTEIKGVGEALKLLETNTNIFNLGDVYDELEKIDINANIKNFVKFILDTSKNVVEKQNQFDINQGILDFSKRIMGEPEIFYEFLKPFVANKIDKDKLAISMKDMQEKIGVENLSKVKVDPLNIRLKDFEEMSELAGIAPGFKQAEKKINDSVNDFNKKIFGFIDETFGVASLTTRYNDPLMWSHYALSHTGICIEYDFEEYLENLEDTKMILFPITYSENRVTIDQKFLDKIDLKNIEKKGRKDMLKIFFEGLYTKNTVWKYEDEWRSIVLLKRNTDNYLRKIDFNKITAIYLGNKMKEETVKALINIIEINNDLNNVSVFKMINDISEYKTSAVKIK